MTEKIQSTNNVSQADDTGLSEVGEKRFTAEKFWGKLTNHAVSAGVEVVEAALKLFYALQDADTPASAKAVILGALAYFILPTDAVFDLLPGGYVDDWGALAAALWTVAENIKEEHTEKAKQKAKAIFKRDEPEVEDKR